MSLGPPPIPEMEKIVWKHSGASAYKSKPVSIWWGRIGRILQKLFLIGAVIFYGFQFVDFLKDFLNDPDQMKADFVLTLLLLFALGVLIFISVKFRHKFQPPSFSVKEASGVALWLSEKHLGFEPSHTTKVNFVLIEEIKGLSLDYSEGAPAVSVDLPKKTLTLISSEANKLLQSLYGLRPDLEPTQ